MMMEADADRFNVNPDYYKMVQRPTTEEYKALDESIIVNGQLYPIIVNKNMTILDGHTRYEILQARGKLIKYEIREFKTREDEIAFVMETNVMRRHLKAFQKVEIIYSMYKKEKEKKVIKNLDTMCEILHLIKEGHNTTELMEKQLDIKSNEISRILRGLVEDYCVRRNEKRKPTGGRGTTRFYEYELLPKAESRLAKLDSRNGTLNVNIGRTIGVSRQQMQYAITVIENADESIKEKIRNETLSLTEAFTNITKVGKKIKTQKKRQIQCPHCKHIGDRGTFVKV